MSCFNSLRCDNSQHLETGCVSDLISKTITCYVSETATVCVCCVRFYSARMTESIEALEKAPVYRFNISVTLKYSQNTNTEMLVHIELCRLI